MEEVKYFFCVYFFLQGVAIVEYESYKDAAKAIDEYDNRELDNQILSVVSVADL